MLIELRCPIDDLVLIASKLVPVKGGAEEIGQSATAHLHYESTFDATCLNGHAWYADLDLHLLRGIRPVKA